MSSVQVDFFFKQPNSWLNTVILFLQILMIVILEVIPLMFMSWAHYLLFSINVIAVVVKRWSLRVITRVMIKKAVFARMIYYSRTHSSYLMILTDSHGEFENIFMCSSLPIAPERLERLQNETESDDILRMLRTVIVQDWPDHKSKLPSMLAPYHCYADELTVKNGVIFEGVIVLSSMKVEMRKIYTSLIWMKLDVCTRHVDVYSRSVWRLRLGKWYPNVKHVANVRFQSQKKLKWFLMTQMPWEKVAVECFEIDGKSYLVIIDYFNNFWEIDFIENE